MSTTLQSLVIKWLLGIQNEYSKINVAALLYCMCAKKKLKREKMMRAGLRNFNITLLCLIAYVFVMGFNIWDLRNINIGSATVRVYNTKSFGPSLQTVKVNCLSNKSLVK